MPDHLGFRYHTKLDCERLEYGSLDFLRSITSTHAVEGLPDVYGKYEERAKALAERIAPRLARLIAQDIKLRQNKDDVSNDR